MLLLALALVILAITAVWYTSATKSGGSNETVTDNERRSEFDANQALACDEPVHRQRVPIWRPGQGREELADLIARATAGDAGAAWDVFNAIDYCFGVPASDRDLRRALNRKDHTDQPAPTIAEHEHYVADKAAQVREQYEEQLRSRYAACKDVPRAAGTAYDWLQRAAAGGLPDARIEFYQQGLRYAGDSHADRARHTDSAKEFLTLGLAAGDGRALPRLGQILRHEPVISSRQLSPDLVEVYALFSAASSYATIDDSLEDWRPAWTDFLASADKILTPEQLNQGQLRSMEYLKAVGCELDRNQ